MARPPPLFPEDRLFLDSDESSDSGESSEQDQDPGPGAGVAARSPSRSRSNSPQPGPSRPRPFLEETPIPTDNPDFRVWIKKVPFRRQIRYGYTDSHFRIRFVKLNNENIPAFGCLDLFREVVKKLILELRRSFRHMTCCYMFLTLTSPLIKGGLPMGGRCLHGSTNDITGAFVTRIYKYLTSNQTMPLDHRMKIMVKTMCEEHAQERERLGTLPDIGHQHENNRGQGPNILKEKDFKDFIKDPPSDGPFLYKCLILCLILARAKIISHERRMSSVFTPHPDDIPWRLISRCMEESDNNKKENHMKNLRLHMLKIEEKLQLKSTALTEVIPKFCNHYGDVEVFVICPEESFHKFKYSFPESGAGLNKKYKIFLFQEKKSEGEYHIKYIDSIKRYAIEFGGLECIFRCGRICHVFQYPHWKCKFEVCNVCNLIIEKNEYFEDGIWNLLDCYHCDGKKNERAKCVKCNFWIGSKRCMKRHRIRCRKRYLCPDCGKVAYTNNKFNHKCGVTRCIKCNGVIDSKIPKKIHDLKNFRAIHQCSYQKAKLPKKVPNLGFFILGTNEEINCKNCQNGLECHLHDEFESSVKINIYAVVSFEILITKNQFNHYFNLGPLLRISRIRTIQN